MDKKKFHMELVIAFVVGVLLSGTMVYAATTYAANVVYYNKTNTNILSSDDVQEAIDELANQYSAITSCPSNKICIPKKSTLAEGDYISYTPSKTSYTTDMSKTGDTITQTINPSELDLWRVLRINGDGTVDIISEYVSSIDVSFYGKIGYQNFIGYLNVLASQYENPAYTSGSRYFGYNGQTEYITDTSKLDALSAPWKCNTGGSCDPAPVESQGGGDNLDTTDHHLVNTVLGTRVAYKVGTSTLTDYWVASRSYSYGNYTSFVWDADYMSSKLAVSGLSTIYERQAGNFHSRRFSYSLRPIVTLKSGLHYYGSGIREYPMEIVE